MWDLILVICYFEMGGIVVLIGLFECFYGWWEGVGWLFLVILLVNLVRKVGMANVCYDGCFVKGLFLIYGGGVCC